jgi:acetyl-CoA acetyltransferase
MAGQVTMTISKIRILIEAIEARMVEFGFTATNTVFDFDAVPDSIIHKAFRIENRIIENRYNMDNRANPREEIAIWIAYKEKRDARAAWKAGLDDREIIEDDLVNDPTIMALDSDPLLALDSEASSQKYLKEYLVSKLAFTADYLRTIS